MSVGISREIIKKLYHTMRLCKTQTLALIQNSTGHNGGGGGKK